MESVAVFKCVSVNNSALAGWIQYPFPSIICFAPYKLLPKNPTSLFGLDGFKGPKLRAAHPGTIIEETGYVAALLLPSGAGEEDAAYRSYSSRSRPGLSLGDVPARSDAFILFFASVPIAVSIGTCALCAVFEDWYASSLIFVGIIASGVSSFALGSADFVLTHPQPAKGSLLVTGILGSGTDIVLLRGTEGSVNSITRGRFILRFSSEGQYNLIRRCSLLFFVQSIIQLFLIPQASLCGQIMFLASLDVSALVLAGSTLIKYTLGTRTTAVMFMLLVLRPQDPTKLLNELLSNDTNVWKHWKGTILERLRQPSVQAFQFGGKAGDLNGLTQEEKDLSKLLYEDAQAAYPVN
ncbi:hypothetical protein L210DRAFT_3507237 [Boletus edulis BED1]|uniref:Uncharacterized protein n=1 Tax=Boletus edulis BED1 TaxID=1328754 RepID=A0AAD4G9Q8_BOLED|nr:hypothetical protein L210DRAFT_3507237 [Boletus edulis BED1]